MCEDFLAGLRDSSRRCVHNEDGRKANLWATIGPADRPGIVLSGPHGRRSGRRPGLVVRSLPLEQPRRQSLWPRHGRHEGLHRLLPAPSPRRPRRAPLQTPIHLAFSYDEEIGCVGVRRLLDLLKDAPVKPRLCIVGEPTLMQAVTAHKGKLGFRVTAHGLEAHSSLAPIGVNAIYMASRSHRRRSAPSRRRSPRTACATATTRWPTPRCMSARCRAAR